MALTGVKFRAYPTQEQKLIISKWIGCARFIYNAKCDEDLYYRAFLCHSLALTGEKIPIDQTYSQFKTELSSWLNDCPSQILRNSAVRWYQGYQRFFQGLSGRPKKKKKGQRDSIWLTSELFRFDQSVDLATGKASYKLFIGTKENNIGYLSFYPHREFSIPNSVTISRKNGDYLVSFNYEDGLDISDPIKVVSRMAEQGEAALMEAVEGLDRGVVIPLQASSGASFDFTPEQKRAIAREEQKIRCYQKQLSKKKDLNSNRRKKLKQKIASSHQHIANIRKDFAHKSSRKLVDSEKTIFIAEDLKVKNMTAKPAAKKDEQGRYVPNRAKAKAGLNRAILNAAWGMMVIFLAYKAFKVSKVVIKLPPHDSSQECVVCGHTHPDNRQRQSEFICQNCGHTENADLMASKVMRKRGVKKILSVPSNEWEIQSDHTLKLGTESTRGTRGRARRGNDKTLAAKTSKVIPESRVRSELSANLVRELQSTVVMTDLPSQEAPSL
jgi:putative transposase